MEQTTRAIFRSLLVSGLIEEGGGGARSHLNVVFASSAGCALSSSTYKRLQNEKVSVKAGNQSGLSIRQDVQFASRF